MYGKDTPSEDNDVVRRGRKKTSWYLEHEGTISTKGSLVASLVIREKNEILDKLANYGGPTE